MILEKSFSHMWHVVYNYLYYDKTIVIYFFAFEAFSLTRISLGINYIFKGLDGI